MQIYHDSFNIHRVGWNKGLRGDFIFATTNDFLLQFSLSKGTRWQSIILSFWVSPRPNHYIVLVSFTILLTLMNVSDINESITYVVWCYCRCKKKVSTLHSLLDWSWCEDEGRMSIRLNDLPDETLHMFSTAHSS